MRQIDVVGDDHTMAGAQYGKTGNQHLSLTANGHGDRLRAVLDLSR